MTSERIEVPGGRNGGPWSWRRAWHWDCTVWKHEGRIVNMVRSGNRKSWAGFEGDKRQGERVNHGRELPAEVSNRIEKRNKYFIRQKITGVVLRYAQSIDTMCFTSTWMIAGIGLSLCSVLLELTPVGPGDTVFRGYNGEGLHCVPCILLV